MKIKKADFVVVLEAEQDGLAAAMTSTVLPKRTDLNKELSTYLRVRVPGLPGFYSEDEGEELLYNINDYIKEKNVDFPYRLDYPVSEGSEVYLIPFSKNVQLKILVADEYHGSGEYSKYVNIDTFLINDDTSVAEVDKLIEFAKEYLVR